MEKIKNVWLIVILVLIFVFGGLVWWSISDENQNLNQETNSSGQCNKDEDCKLIYSNCDCLAVPKTDSRDSLESIEVCKHNLCRANNTTAVCQNNKCAKSEPSTAEDKCDVGKDLVTASEIANYACEELSGCEWSARGGKIEMHSACCPIDENELNKLGPDSELIYSRCFTLVD